MAKLSIAIQTHELREEMAADLNACLGGVAEIVSDPDPGGVPNPWRTYRAAIERTRPEVTSRLIIQDDTLICDRFVEGVELAVVARPDRVLVFFVAGHPYHHVRAVREACARDETWAELSLGTWIPVVAVLWPARLIAPFPAWVDEQRFPPAFTADDEIVGRYLHAHDERPLASVPSLVEHPDTVPTITASRRVHDGRDPGRRAACFIGDLGFCDATLIDWTTGAG